MIDSLFFSREAIATGSRSSSIFPASTFERSRMSLISDSRCFPLLKMSPTKWRCFSVRSPSRPSASTSEKPMIALSGVRSSCDMLARNADFMRLASSSSTFFRCSACSIALSSVMSRAEANTPCRRRSRS
jgi:hypothetical protein